MSLSHYTQVTGLLCCHVPMSSFMFRLCHCFTLAVECCCILSQLIAQGQRSYRAPMLSFMFLLCLYVIVCRCNAALYCRDDAQGFGPQPVPREHHPEQHLRIVQSHLLVSEPRKKYGTYLGVKSTNSTAPTFVRTPRTAQHIPVLCCTPRSWVPAHQ